MFCLRNQFRYQYHSEKYWLIPRKDTSTRSTTKCLLYTISMNSLNFQEFDFFCEGGENTGVKVTIHIYFSNEESQNKVCELGEDITCDDVKQISMLSIICQMAHSTKCKVR